METESKPISRPRIFSIANQKGGVGKTTTAVNLGTALGAIGKNVLLIDLDPQGNASTGLGIDQKDRHPSIYHVLLGQESISSVVRASDVPNLFVAPASAELAGAEIELIQTENRSYRLRQAIDVFVKEHQKSNAESTSDREDLQPTESGVTEELSQTSNSSLDGSGSDCVFDFILIDCPPSLNLLTVNALATSNGVLVPLQCEFFALEGLSQLLHTIERVRATLNRSLEIQGIVLTMFDKRNNLSGQVAADVREHFGDKVYDTVIPRNVRVSEAPSFGKPALLYDYKCPGSQAYIKLAVEIIQRERLLAEV